MNDRGGYRLVREAKFDQKDELIPAKILAVLGSSGAYSYTIQLGWWDMRTGAATGGTWTPKPAARTYTAFPENLTTTTALNVNQYCQVRRRGRDNSGNIYFTVAGTPGSGGGAQLLSACSLAVGLVASGTFSSVTASITPYMNSPGTVLRLTAGFTNVTGTGDKFQFKTNAGTVLGGDMKDYNTAGGAMVQVYVATLVMTVTTTANSVSYALSYNVNPGQGPGFPAHEYNFVGDSLGLTSTPGAISVVFSTTGGTAGLSVLTLEKLS